MRVRFQWEAARIPPGGLAHRMGSSHGIRTSLMPMRVRLQGEACIHPTGSVHPSHGKRASIPREAGIHPTGSGHPSHGKRAPIPREACTHPTGSVHPSHGKRHPSQGRDASITLDHARIPPVQGEPPMGRKHPSRWSKRPVLAECAGPRTGRVRPSTSIGTPRYGPVEPSCSVTPSYGHRGDGGCALVTPDCSRTWASSLVVPSNAPVVACPALSCPAL
jgi:hypothetical protein